MMHRVAPTHSDIVVSMPPDDIADAVAVQVEAAMEASNRAHVGEEHERRYVLAAHDGQGRLVGGLVGLSSWDYLYLENLWVAPDCRGQGIGQRLVRELEARAPGWGFRMIQLYTFSFEAPDFYAKLGYTLAGKIEDAPSGTTDHWFYKRLTPAG